LVVIVEDAVVIVVGFGAAVFVLEAVEVFGFVGAAIAAVGDAVVIGVLIAIAAGHAMGVAHAGDEAPVGNAEPVVEPAGAADVDAPLATGLDDQRRVGLHRHTDGAGPERARLITADPLDEEIEPDLAGEKAEGSGQAPVQLLAAGEMRPAVQLRAEAEVEREVPTAPA